MSVEVLCLDRYDPTIIGKIIEVDTSAFGKNTLTPYTIEAFMRFGKVFVILDDNKIAGVAEYMQTWSVSRTVYLVGMAIRKDIQDRGLGTRLMGDSIKLLRKEGIRRIVLHVDPKNQRALHVYRDKFLFRKAEFRKDEYGLGLDRLFLVLDIE